MEIVRQLLEKEDCDRLVKAAYGIDSSEPEKIVMPHVKSAVFAQVMKDQKVAKIAFDVVGECDGLGSDYFFHPVGAKGMAVHTDNDYVEADPNGLVSIWIALCDVDRNNGCLYTELEDIILAKGDAVVIGQDEKHGSYHNQSNQCRHALLLTYISKKSNFRPGNTQKRARYPLMENA